MARIIGRRHTALVGGDHRSAISTRRLSLLLVFLSLVAPLVLAMAQPARAVEVATFEPVSPIPVTADDVTGEKPQSKVWLNGGSWWTVLPSASVAPDPSGTWLWKLAPDKTWTHVLLLSTATTAIKADVKRVGNVAHILLHDTTSASLVSIEYVSGAYQLWSARPASTAISLPGSETATIDIDSTGRMWLATESGSNLNVYYSDSPYTTFSGPVTLETNIAGDDIGVVTALPNNTVGVLWSNQNTDRFGFKAHVDGADPATWSADEVPASQSALTIGSGMADDHVNVAVASDGTLYAAVKTSYNQSGTVQIALLVRRPSGVWDDLYEIDNGGTRPIVLLNEADGSVRVVYTSSEGFHSLLMKTSATSTISFGLEQVLIDSAVNAVNNVTSTKENWTGRVLVLTTDASLPTPMVRGGFISLIPTVNNPPVASDGSLVVLKNTPTAGTLGATDADSDPLTLSIVTNGTSGTAVVTDPATGAYTYTPNTDVTGSDTFTFKANDGTVDSNTATISVTIYDPTLPPSVPTGLVATPAKGQVSLDWADNTEPDLASYTVYRAEVTTGPYTPIATGLVTSAHTDLAVVNGTSYFYVVTATDTATNESGYSAEVSATPINHPPVASGGAWQIWADTVLTGTLAATDADSDPLTFSIVANGTSGTAVVTNPATGAFTYTPNPGATGSDTFTFKANDGTSDSNVATVNVTIAAIPQLVGWWPADEGSGTTLLDSSVVGNDATIFGNTTWGPGKIGQAVVFDGVGDYATVADNPTLTMTNAITIAAWVRADKVGTQRLVTKEFYSSTDGYELSLSGGSKPFVRFNQATNGNTHRVDAVSSYLVGTWMHVAATYDGTTIRLYINGVLENSKAATITIASNTLPLSIGSEPDGVTYELQGAMDDIRLYRRALSASEISDLASLTVGGSIGGLVTDGVGVPLERVCVAAFADPSGVADGFAVSGVDGRFLVGGLPAGSYSLRYSDCASSSYAVGWGSPVVVSTGVVEAPVKALAYVGWGMLRVTTSPAVPSRISVDGGPADTWGLTWVKVPAVSHTVGFSALSAFDTPTDQPVAVSEGLTSTVAGVFAQRGVLRVVTSPPLPATVYVDGVPRNDWGVWTDLSTGSYQVCFGAVEGYQAPPCEQAVISAGMTSTVTGTYVVDAGAVGPTGFGMLRVTTSPAVPSQISVDGVVTDTWGLTWMKIAPGQHTISFSPVAGFVTPADVTVNVTDGVTSQVTGVFGAAATLRVVTSPALPATIYVDGMPANDWGVWTDFAAGDHLVCLGVVAGYTSPACQTATLVSGSTTFVTLTATPSGGG